jgi:hypothetical protein
MVHTAEPLVSGSSHLEIEFVIAKLGKYRELGSDKIPAELLGAGGEILVPAIHTLISSNWNKENDKNKDK